MSASFYREVPRIRSSGKHAGRRRNRPSQRRPPSPPTSTTYTRISSDNESDGSSSDALSDVLSDVSSDDLPVIGNDALPDLDSVLERFISTSGKETLPRIRVSNNEQGWSSNLVPGRTVTSVYRAQYTGDGNTHGDHSIDLTTYGETPVYEWIHLEQPHMDFDNFQKQVLDISSLSLIKRQSIANLFKRVPRTPKTQWLSRQVAPVDQAHVEPFFIERPLPDDVHTYNNRTLRQRMVRFWSLPFFYLGHVQGQMPALLQASYNNITEIRDKQQAVHQVLKDSKLRLYIPQLWCITIDQSLLITCAQVSHETLRGDLVSLTKGPSSLIASEPRIFVSYGQNTVWQIPLAECKTWFSLLSHFKEFWYNHFHFLCLGKQIKPRDWPYVYTIAQRANKLTLEFVVDRPRKFSYRKHVLASPPDKKSVSEPQPVSTEAQRGYVLPILSKHGVSDAESPRVLEDYLSRLDIFLSSPIQEMFEHLGRRVMSKSYKTCPTADCEAVRLFVAQQIKSPQTDTVEASSESKSLARSLLHERILVHAEFLFKLFLPLDSNARIVSKFWGAVNRVIQVTMTSTASSEDETHSNSSSDWSATDLLDKLDGAVQSAILLFDMLETVSADELNSIHLPSRLSKAWIWLVLFFVSRGDASLEAASDNCMSSFKIMMEKSTFEFVNQSPRSEILQQSLMLPTDIGILLSLQVLKDVTTGQFDVVTIYEEYRNQLDLQINTDSSQRSSQVTLHHLEEEIRILLKTAREQETIVQDIFTRSKDHGSVEKMTVMDAEKTRNAKLIKYHRYETERMNPYTRRPTYAVVDSGSSLVDKISARDSGGLHHAFASECMRRVTDKVSKLQTLMVKVNALRELNERKFNANRDRQDLALYAFSIVTVIFLPISTVASVLGMNTNDIRNLDANQWLFWAVATPLAVTIVFGGLLWAGELGNTFRGFIARFQSEEKKASPRDLHDNPRNLSPVRGYYINN